MDQNSAEACKRREGVSRQATLPPPQQNASWCPHLSRPCVQIPFRVGEVHDEAKGL